jgi:flagellar export protein FliJ
MPVSPALKRLLRIRELEEELSKSALESAVAEREHFRRKLAMAVESNRSGRRLWGESVHAGDCESRHAAVEEMRLAAQLTGLASAKLVAAEKELNRRRENYLATRTVRRQAETIIDEAEQRDAQVALRRNQQELDEWFRSNALRDAKDQTK